MMIAPPGSTTRTISCQNGSNHCRYSSGVFDSIQPSQSNPIPYGRSVNTTGIEASGWDRNHAKESPQITSETFS